VSIIVLEDATGKPFVNPGPFSTKRYFVPAQNTVSKNPYVQVNDCYNFIPGASFSAMLKRPKKRARAVRNFGLCGLGSGSASVASK
jgi:hypothetical protein